MQHTSSPLPLMLVTSGCVNHSKLVGKKCAKIPPDMVVKQHWDAPISRNFHVHCHRKEQSQHPANCPPGMGLSRFHKGRTLHWCDQRPHRRHNKDGWSAGATHDGCESQSPPPGCTESGSRLCHARQSGRRCRRTAGVQ